MKKLNVKLLRKIQAYITEEPRRFFMSDFFVKENWNYNRSFFGDLSATPPPCRTAACIAGTTNLLTKGRYLGDWQRAGLKLRIDPHELESHPLFTVLGWPDPFQSDYERARTPKQRAKIACKRIDWLIEHGE